MRKRIKKRLLVGLLALLLLPFSGCFDAVDMGDQIFAVNLALDTGKGNALRLTVQFPQITPTGKAEGSSGGEESELAKDGYQIEQVEGENFSACMALLRMVTPRSVDLNQLRGVFLSEALSARPEAAPSKQAAHSPKQAAFSPEQAAHSPEQMALSPEQAAVLAALAEGPETVSQLCERCALPAGVVLAALTALELLGLARLLPGRMAEAVHRL